MAETFETHRELEVNKSADEVWEWLSNVGNAMTINQFHAALDCDPADVRDPKVGLDVPIVHEIYGSRHIRLGKITKYEDYEIAWGERLPDPNVPDRFPHSEGWTVEALGPGRCLLRNRLRGRHLFPLSDAIGKELWDALIPSVLDNDLQDVALAVGAIERTQHVEVPRLAMILHLLSRAKEIDGVPATEFFAH
ncbi:MAG: hypothetical protein ABSH03_06665 [Candidatus Lustribacter sp.]|jgi:hypothetical protein